MTARIIPTSLNDVYQRHYGEFHNKNKSVTCARNVYLTGFRQFPEPKVSMCVVGCDSTSPLTVGIVPTRGNDGRFLEDFVGHQKYGPVVLIIANLSARWGCIYPVTILPNGGEALQKLPSFSLITILRHS